MLGTPALKRLTRLPTLLRAPLCRRCTSGTGPYPFAKYGAGQQSPELSTEEPSAKQLAYADVLAQQVQASRCGSC